VLWKDGDVFSGEDEPATLVDWPWPFAAAFAVDAFGDPQPVRSTPAASSSRPR